MSENWKLQISFKIDNVHMLNLRAETSEELSAQVAWAVENKEQLLIACAALGGDKKAPPVAPTHQGPVGVPAASYRPPVAAGEVGPVQIKGVSKTALKKDGTAMKSPKYTVEFSNGKKLSTFEALVGQAAEALSGQSVYYSTKVNGEYVNLAEVRSAG